MTLPATVQFTGSCTAQRGAQLVLEIESELKYYCKLLHLEAVDKSYSGPYTVIVVVTVRLRLQGSP